MDFFKNWKRGEILLLSCESIEIKIYKVEGGYTVIVREKHRYSNDDLLHKEIVTTKLKREARKIVDDIYSYIFNELNNKRVVIKA